jgi:hypothetical protein
LDQLQKIYRNAQAISILTSSTDKEEFNHVGGLNVAKDVWTTLRMPHDMYIRLKKLVNKARALGSKKWDDRMLMAYTLMNYNLVALIHQNPAYKKTSDDVLGRIMNHEMNIQEANNIKNLYKGVTTFKKQDIAHKATNKSKKKKAIIERPCEEEEEEDEDEKEYDEEETTLFIKKFNKFISKRRPIKGDKKERPRSKMVCYNCGKNRHFIAQCLYERKEKYNEKKKMFDNGYKKDIKFTKKKPYGQAHVGQEWNSSDESSW